MLYGEFSMPCPGATWLDGRRLKPKNPSDQTMRSKIILLLGFVAFTVSAQTFEPKTTDPYFQEFHPAKAPKPSRLILKRGDRLAICGDSITEQKMYSRIMEDYLTMCAPELDVSVRQYGWGGERAPGFLARMTNDCLRVKLPVASNC